MLPYTTSPLPVFSNTRLFFFFSFCGRVTFPSLDSSSALLSEKRRRAWLREVPIKRFHTAHGPPRAQVVPAEGRENKIAPVSAPFFRQPVPSSVWTCPDSLSLPLSQPQHPKEGCWTASSDCLLIAQAFSEDVDEVALLTPRTVIVHTSPASVSHLQSHPPSHSSSKKLPARLRTADLKIQLTAA